MRSQAVVQSTSMVALAPNTSETSSWDVLETFPKLHSRAREVETTRCTDALPSKSLGRVEIWLVIYDCRVGLESFTRDPIGYRDGLSLYGSYFLLSDLDPSGLDIFSEHFLDPQNWSSFSPIGHLFEPPGLDLFFSRSDLDATGNGGCALKLEKEKAFGTISWSGSTLAGATFDFLNGIIPDSLLRILRGLAFSYQVDLEYFAVPDQVVMETVPGMVCVYSCGCANDIEKPAKRAKLKVKVYRTFKGKFSWVDHSYTTQSTKEIGETTVYGHPSCSCGGSEKPPQGCKLQGMMLEGSKK